MKSFINFKLFLISFSIGLLYIYLTDDYKQTIIVYPTPVNKDKQIFVDKGDNCFKYNLAEINCDENENNYISVKANY